ncbi:hypothetical protein KBY58_05385 [Cyanobium sp. HWJ4-Hawea]|uniref:hypothetical protein n=1 Tax=Cyanobium sp. HWJ4-Hawea TaxID=2823713 RepID=UPI0020CF0D75|nr:hypothetical protein [Cyanobium sp. HWJ4-Hawea]MCP9808860.1 hypothetical protein [Cyanobium sp. HWJ4-Hawea]
MDLLVDARLELERFGEQLSSSNPELYRHLALYLQVLRQGLLNSLQQACFHVSTQIDPQRYLQLSQRRRQHLHLRLISLASRASSLLTVEQLCQLANQMHKNRLRSHRNRQQRLFEALQGQGTNDGQISSQGPVNSLNPSFRPPEGSVNLGLALPLGRNFLGETGLAALMPSEVVDRLRSDGPQEDEVPVIDQPGALEAMAAVFSEAFSSFDDSPEASTPWDGGQLPVNPATLLRWLEGFERALVQRLRNLSHAVNVELLRQEVTSSLLPVSLLDAVLQGQMDPLTAPTNVLRLQLPLMAEDSSPSMESVAVLLRLADLEQDQPKLRTCRSRLQQHHQEVRRMAQQYRRLERRVQALEAEKLWLQDISTAKNS